MMFDKIDTLKKQLDEFRPLDNDLMQVLQEKLRIAWTYNSNAIEGNTLTFGETAFFLREGLTSEGKPLKDYLEAKNHAEAIDMLHDVVINKRKITEGLVKNLHALLLKDIHFTYAKGANDQLIKKPLNAGKYKERPNHVLTLSGRVHHYVSPLHVKDEMEKLVHWLGKAKDIHPVERAALFHYRFVAIHPFDDGNGRLARLLMNLILMQSGYPICIVKNEHRRQYLNAIELADNHKSKMPFVYFIADELYATEKMMLDTLRGEEKEDFGESSPRLNREERHALILKTLSNKCLSISQIVEKVPIKRSTLKKDLQNLVKAKKIKRKGVGKGTLYYK